jgi:hypothetical protein
VAIITAPLIRTSNSSMAGSWAGLSNRAVLEVHEGDLVVSEGGALIENLEIRGQLLIQANDVVVRNVWVYGSPVWLVKNEGSVTLENMEIGNPDHLGLGGIVGGNVVGRGLDIHHVEDGIKLSSNSLYENVYVHDLQSPQEKPHSDAVQASGATTNVTVRNSILDSTGPDGNGNAAAIIKSDFGPISDISITGSYLNGGNYTVYVRDGGYGMPTGVRFENNRIGPNRTFGLISTDGPIVWTDNVWDATGEPVNSNKDIPPGVPAEGNDDPTTTVPTTAAAPTTSGATSTSATTTAPAETSTSMPSTDGASAPASTNDTIGVENVAARAVDDGGTGSEVLIALAAIGTTVLLVGLAYLAVRRKWID